MFDRVLNTPLIASRKKYQKTARKSMGEGVRLSQEA